MCGRLGSIAPAFALVTSVNAQMKNKMFRYIRAADIGLNSVVAAVSAAMVYTNADGTPAATAEHSRSRIAIR
jgi:hypothetical protein